MDVNLPSALRILVVDDEPDMVFLLDAHLRAAGYTVFSARDGLEGLQQAQSLMPDLILLDARLPGLDGLSACDLLHRLPSTGGIPVVILSCWSGAVARAEGLAAGAVDYIGKPFEIHDLLQRIKAALLASRSAQEENEGGPEEVAERCQFAASALE